jgi:hypothetical protein
MTPEQHGAHQSYMLHEYPWVRIKDLERQVRNLKLVIFALSVAGTITWLGLFV